MKITIEDILNLFGAFAIAGLTIILAMHYLVPWVVTFLRSI